MCALKWDFMRIGKNTYYRPKGCMDADVRGNYYATWKKIASEKKWTCHLCLSAAGGKPTLFMSLGNLRENLWHGGGMDHNTLLKYHAPTPCYSLSMPSIEYYLCEQKWVLKMSKNFHRWGDACGGVCAPPFWLQLRLGLAAKTIFFGSLFCSWPCPWTEERNTR